MKRRIGVLLAMLLLLTAAGCATQKAAAQAEECCHDFMDALADGDWEDVQTWIGQDSLYSLTPQDNGEDTILTGLLDQVDYDLVSSEQADNGVITVSLEIENVDMKALLEDLPAGISSKEEARQAMLERMDDAQRKTFEAQLTFVPAKEDGEYQIIVDVSFANALSGGMYDLLQELMEEAMAQ